MYPARTPLLQKRRKRRKRAPMKRKHWKLYRQDVRSVPRRCCSHLRQRNRNVSDRGFRKRSLHSEKSPNYQQRRHNPKKRFSQRKRLHQWRRFCQKKSLNPKKRPKRLYLCRITRIVQILLWKKIPCRSTPPARRPQQKIQHQSWSLRSPVAPSRRPSPGRPKSHVSRTSRKHWNGCATRWILASHSTLVTTASPISTKFSRCFAALRKSKCTFRLFFFGTNAE